MAINYTEKGGGQHEAVAAAGLRLRWINGVLNTADDKGLNANDAAVQAVLDAYLLADAIKSVNNKIDDFAKTLRDKFLKSFSPGEMAAWAVKKAEADKFQVSGLASDAPNLQAEATFRGVTLAALATKVINNFNTQAAREAKIAGNAGKHKDNVQALASFAAVNGYDWQTPMGAV